MLIFVYGSLKKGFPNHFNMDGSIFIGFGETKDLFEMYPNMAHRFPYLVHNRGRGLQIHGELYEVPTSIVISRIDPFEGTPPYDRHREDDIGYVSERRKAAFYDREEVLVKMESGVEVKAWIYITVDESDIRFDQEPLSDWQQKDIRRPISSF